MTPSSGVKWLSAVMFATISFTNWAWVAPPKYGGGPGSIQGFVGSVRDILGMVFVVGLRLAAPVLVVLLIVELGIGLISRASPSLSFMVIGYPVRIAVGLFVVATLIYTVPAVTASMIEGAILLAGRTAGALR